MRRTLGGLALALALVGAQAAWVARDLGWLHRPRQVRETDHAVYIEMARAAVGRAAVDPPFCARVGVPQLARSLERAGLDLNAAFYLVTNVGLVLFLLALHAQLGSLGFSPPVAALGTVLTALLPAAVRWYQYQYWMTDPACLFLVTLALGALRSGREWPLPALGVLGMAVRETYLLAFVAHAAWLVPRRGWPKALMRAALFALPGLAAAAWVRLVLVSCPEDDLLATILDVLGFRARHLLDNQLYFATVGSFGALLALALAVPRRLLERLRRHPEEAAAILLAYASLAAANNTDRLLVYAAPALLPAALEPIRAAAARGRVHGLALGAAALAAQALLWRVTPWREMGASIYQATNLWVVAAMLALWALARRLATPRA
jgi:hypothetical protein